MISLDPDFRQFSAAGLSLELLAVKEGNHPQPSATAGPARVRHREQAVIQAAIAPVHGWSEVAISPWTDHPGVVPRLVWERGAP